MDKSILLAAAAVTSVSTVASVYYISPVAVVDHATPSILVDAAPSDVIKRIHSISLDQLSHHYIRNEGERDLVPLFIELDRTDRPGGEMIFDVHLVDDLFVQFKVLVKPAVGGKSEVDVTAIMPDNRLTTDASLHPYDIRLMESVADYFATDYISSVLKAHAPLTNKQIEDEFKRRFGASEENVKQAARRIEKAYLAAYGDDLRSATAGYATTEYEPSDGSDDDYVSSQIVDGADRAAAAAEITAAAADMAAEAAAEGY